MKHLKALLTQISAALGRLGSGAARRDAAEQILQIARQGMLLAGEIINTNAADFVQHFEEWYGNPPRPITPREDPRHASKARMGRFAEWFLLILKIAFWIIFGPAYFSVLPWLAVVVAIAISVPLSLGVKPLLAVLILKPGLTPYQQERRLHAHVVVGLIAFGTVFGGLFLLRGLAGPLALLGATFVLPILSACDLVLLHLMGVSHAYVELYGWATPFVQIHKDATAFFGAFQRHHNSAQKRIDNDNDDDEGPRTGGLVPNPLTPRHPDEAIVAPADPQQKGGEADHLRLSGTATTFILIVLALLGVGRAGAQAPDAGIEVDSTVSVFPTVAETITPAIAHSFTTWAKRTVDFGISIRHPFLRDSIHPAAVPDIARPSVTKMFNVVAQRLHGCPE